MSNDPFQFPGGPGAASPSPHLPPGDPMPKGALPGTSRHALGLPAGSIRATLAFIIFGLIWALMYMHLEIPLYLQYLMFLVLGHYFAAHQKSIKPYDQREWAPLYLPSGAIRVLILLGFAVVLIAIVYQHRNDTDTLVDELKMKGPHAQNLFMPVLLLIGFFVGLVIARLGQLIGGRAGQPGWYQDVQAWLALLATLGLGVAVIVHSIINPSLVAEGKEVLALPHLEFILTPIVGFYFGARS